MAVVTADSLRERILDDLETTIGAISAGDTIDATKYGATTYLVSVEECTRRWLDPEDFHSAKGGGKRSRVYIRPRPEVRNQGGEGDASLGDFASVFIIDAVVVLTVTRTDAESNGLSKIAEAFIADIHRAIMVDESRGEASDDVYCTVVSDVSGLEMDESRKRLGFIVTIEVRYRSERTAP